MDAWESRCRVRRPAGLHDGKSLAGRRAVSAVLGAASMLLLSSLTTGSAASAQELAERDLPPINAMVPNFYYDDLDAAREWYAEKMGFRTIVDIGWVVIVELGPGMQLALVDGERGTLTPVAEKGALLVIETDALEAWYRHVSAIDGIQWYQYDHDTTRSKLKHGIMEHREIEEFRVLDPGGYIIEFFRWKPDFRP